MSNVAPLSREERKNEQIIRMIERQEKLRIRKEQKKQGIQVRKLLFAITYFRSPEVEKDVAAPKVPVVSRTKVY